METLDGSMNTRLAWLLMGAVAATALLLASPVQRRRGLAGIPILGLAFAGWTVAGSVGSPETSASFLATTAALLLLGSVIPVGLMISSLRPPERRGFRWVASFVPATVAVLAVIALVLPLMRRGGWGPTLLAFVVLAGAAAAGVVAARVLRPGRLVRRIDGWFTLKNGGPSMDVPVGTSLVIAGACAGGALIAPHLLVLLMALVVGMIAGQHPEVRRAGWKAGWPPALLITLALLLLSSYLLVQVAWGSPFDLRSLLDAPYSEALQLAVALTLTLSGWAMLGLWPFHAAPRGPFTSMLGAALLVRLVAPILPDGALHWQPLFYPLAAVAAWHAAATRRDAEALTAFAVLGLISGNPLAGQCGIAVVAGVTSLPLLRRGAISGAGSWEWHEGGRRILAFGGALLVTPLLIGSLRAQVVYTVLAVAGLIVALAAERESIGIVDPVA